jgi:hypothetical protein
VCGYQGPNILLLQDSLGGVFGVYSSSGYRAANQHSGGDYSNFLFRLKPNFAILAPKSSSDGHFQYLNLNGFSVGELLFVCSFCMFICVSLSTYNTHDSNVQVTILQKIYIMFCV